MKRYAVFAGDNHYPSGGWSDFLKSFDTVEEAIAAGKASNDVWWHVIDLTTGEEVASW